MEKVEEQKDLEVNRIRLFAIDRGFDFMEHHNKVKVFKQAGHSFIATAECIFVATVDGKTNEVLIEGECPFSKEEFLQGMTPTEFGEKYGHNHEYLLRPDNEDFFVEDHQEFYKTAR